jgi:hypothetical protein
LKEDTSATDKKIVVKHGSDSLVIEVDSRGYLSFTSKDKDGMVVIELTGGETRTVKEWLDKLP